MTKFNTEQTGQPKVSPHEYSRSERLIMRNTRTGDSGRNPGRRLTLIDLLLLTVMMGVLIPWIVQKNQEFKAGDFRCRIEVKNDVVTLKIRQSAGTDLHDGILVGWTVSSEDGRLLHEEYDLAPEKGGSREFLWRTGTAGQLTCRVIADQITVVRTVSVTH